MDVYKHGFLELRSMTGVLVLFQIILSVWVCRTILSSCHLTVFSGSARNTCYKKQFWICLQTPVWNCSCLWPSKHIHLKSSSKSSFLKSFESCLRVSVLGQGKRLLFPEVCKQDWLIHFSACFPTSLTYHQQGSVQTPERTWWKTVLGDGKNLEDRSNSQWHFSVASGWLFSQSFSCH